MELDVIYNQDCLEGMAKLPDSSIDLIVTDPPYLHVKGGMKSKKYNVGTWKANSHMVQSMSDFGKDEINTFLDIAIPKMKKVNMYIFCSKLQLVHYFEYISRNKKLKYDLLVWDKEKYSMKSTKFFTTDIEYIVRIYQSGVSLYKVLVEDGSKSDINYYMKRQVAQQPKGEHGTMKPVALMERLIKVSSLEGDIVLDSFLGSGTTAVAAVNTNRHYIGFELDPKYFDIACQRLDEAEAKFFNQEVKVTEQ